MDRIDINIWDDYYDDDYVPEGEIQKTYIYVEEYDIFSEDDKKKYLEFLKTKIDGFEYPIKTYMFYYDSKLKYPNLSLESMHFTRWEIKVENMTHSLRHELMLKLRELKLNMGEKQFNIYSES